MEEIGYRSPTPNRSLLVDASCGGLGCSSGREIDVLNRAVACLQGTGPDPANGFQFFTGSSLNLSEKGGGKSKCGHAGFGGVKTKFFRAHDMHSIPPGSNRANARAETIHPQCTFFPHDSQFLQPEALG